MNDWAGKEIETPKKLYWMMQHDWSSNDGQTKIEIRTEQISSCEGVIEYHTLQ